MSWNSWDIVNQQFQSFFDNLVNMTKNGIISEDLPNNTNEADGVISTEDNIRKSQTLAISGHQTPKVGQCGHWKDTVYHKLSLQWHSSVHWGLSSRHSGLPLNCHWITTGFLKTHPARGNHQLMPTVGPPMGRNMAKAVKITSKPRLF